MDVLRLLALQVSIGMPGMKATILIALVNRRLQCQHSFLDHIIRTGKRTEAKGYN
jgi:hypothetical protein